MTGRTIRDFGIAPGVMEPGARDLISDVPGVTVGHRTIDRGGIKSGVTVVMPCPDNMFLSKLTAACFVQNGFGKSCGLVQIRELGTLETPICLTGTMNVGLAADALTGYMIERCKADGYDLRSVNPVVGECNDSCISDITARPVREADVLAAIADAGADFSQGDTGAGKGTVCYGLKGGIGSASRVFDIGGETYTLGVLVQSNFGAAADLTVCGRSIGRTIAERGEAPSAVLDRGSVMMIVATDLPADARQMERIIRRCAHGLARTGGYSGNGSGEVMIGFTTANRVPHEGGAFLTRRTVRDGLLDGPFRACVEATEEAILNSMTAASPVRGRDGVLYRGLAEYLERGI